MDFKETAWAGEGMVDVQSFVSPVSKASDFIKCRDLLNRLSGC